ncbi:MAG: hypothetical protein BSOLF_2312 [Candidatus Carbobacillus altaicus]|uniref:Uncharacterized protein n=1 Tax=Candidatus Carbonibacillus altaicus TaxID=2163959 RepID=A0A2R6Y322_9BACL|nr:MAG: hypothetical protein BSOLF_2312 [Candidatus Carbobacillus altaicus]
MDREEEKRRAIIVGEIRKWRASKLLPDPYLLFLLKLYGVFDAEPTPARPREKWFFFFQRFLPYIGVAILSSLITWLVFVGKSRVPWENVTAVLAVVITYGGVLLPFLTLFTAALTARFPEYSLGRNVSGLFFVMALMFTALWINLWFPHAAPWTLGLTFVLWLVAASWWRLFYHWALGLFALLIVFIFRLWHG